MQQRTRSAKTLESAYELHFMEKSGAREVRVDVEMDGGESCDIPAHAHGTLWF